ncbi:MAG: 2-oxoacid:acceptor oxidoreductase subunit alpha [Atribacterota bacterium]
MKTLIQGNEAIVEGAILSGVKFFSGYPITPANEVLFNMNKKLPKIGGFCLQAEDEIASLGNVLGSSLTGVKSMTATSGPGFSLMQEMIGFACAAEIPCVIINVMRGGPSTGIPTQVSQEDVFQSRWGTHGDHPVIVLAPSTVLDCFNVTVKAVNFSEKFRTPVVVLSDKVVSHTRENIEIPDKVEIFNRLLPKDPPNWYKPYKTDNGCPPMGLFGSEYRSHVTGLVHDVNGYPTQKPEEIKEFKERLYRKFDMYLKEIQLYEEYMTEDADILIISFGSVARTSIEVVNKARENGIKAGLFKIITLWPLPEKKIKEHIADKKLVIVPELNIGHVYRMVRKIGHEEQKIKKLSKIDGTLITPNELYNKMSEYLTNIKREML